MVFIKTYKSTVTTIIRSPLTWATVALLLVNATYSILAHPLHAYYNISIGELIQDTDPRFVITYDLYITRVLNTMLTTPLMLFSGPVFFTVVTGIVLQRDWHDRFFEIERCGDVKPACYFFGRLIAVLSFESIFAFIVGMFAFHLYIVSRGGVESLTLWEYIIDSTVRNLRVFFFGVFPGMLLFTAITFLIGNILKNGIIGTIGGLVYVIFAFVSRDFLQFRLPLFYHDYLSPTPLKLYKYWTYYDTEWFHVDYMNPFTTGQMVLCLLSLISISILLFLSSYLCIKRRKI